MPKPYIPNDTWARKAKDDGFRARSIYKLQELDEKFRLLSPRMTVLDLGAAPGSWLQYVSGKIGPKGLAIGIDLQPIETIAPNVVTTQQDIMDLDAVTKIIREICRGNTNMSVSASSASSESFLIDLLLSDAAPSTSGIHDVDQWRSIELNQSALSIGKRLLKTGGRCVLKVFQGADFDAFLRNAKKEWKDVRLSKPKASRDRSTETYIIATNGK